MADEMTRFENAYNQLLAMGFTQEEVYQLLDGNDVKGLTNITKKDAIDVMVLYFRTKKLLEDSHVQQVIKGNAHLKGAASLPKDVQTLFAYESFVDALERSVVIRDVGSGKKEALRTWENYFAEKEAKYARDLKNKGNGTRRQVETFAEIKKDPYDYRFKEYLRQYMDDQTLADVAYAVNTDKVALSVVRGIPFAAGRTKQESYADVVLKYLYADTKVSKEREKNLRLEAQNKNLKDMLAKKGSIEVQLSNTETAILAAIASSSKTVLGSISSSAEKVQSDMAKYFNTLMGTIITNGQARKNEHEKLGRQIKNAEAHIIEDNQKEHEETRSSIKSLKRVVVVSAAVVIAFAVALGTYFGVAHSKAHNGPNGGDVTVGENGGDLPSEKFFKDFNIKRADGFTQAEIDELRQQYGDIDGVNSILDALENQEKHTASDLKPENYAAILGDSEKFARYNAFAAKYQNYANGGFDDAEIAELQTLALAEADPTLSSYFQTMVAAADDEEIHSAGDILTDAQKSVLANNTILTGFLQTFQGSMTDGKIDATEKIHLENTYINANGVSDPLKSYMQTVLDSGMDSGIVEKVPDGLSKFMAATTVDEMKSIAKAESNPSLKAYMNSVISVYENQEMHTDYDMQHDMAEYGKTEAAQYTSFVDLLNKSKVDGLNATEKKALEDQIAIYALNDNASYGYNSTGAMNNLLVAEWDVSELRGQVNKLNIDINGLNNDITTLEKKVAGLEKGNKDKDSEISRLQGEIATLMNTISTKDAEILRLTNLLANATDNAVVQELRDQLATAKEELATAVSKISTLEAKVATLTQKNATLQGQVDTLTDELDAANDRADGLQDKVDELSKNNKDLESQLKEVSNELIALDGEYKKLETKYNNLVEEYNKLLASGTANAEELAALRAQIQELSGDLDSMNSKLSGIYSALGISSIEELYEILDLDYSESTNGSEQDYPQRGQ